MNSGFNTKAIHAVNMERQDNAEVITPSIIPAVAYAFNSVESAGAVVSGKQAGTYYGRYGNPTTELLEQKVAMLEEAEAAVGVSSGMAAISGALLTFLSQGDHVVVTRDVYGGTHKFLTTFASRFGIEYDFVDCTDTIAVERTIKKNTKAIYIETPSNPGLTLVDIEAIGKLAKSYDIPLIIDNTFMTPYLQKPLELGATVVIHSATKYLNGHGDLIAGFVCGDRKTIEYMRKNIMGDLGQPLNAWESFLILRGLKTLGIRMDKHCKSAMEVAKFLESHEMINQVFYPGLCSHPQHTLAKKQMKQMGGIVSFELNVGLEAAKTFVNSLKVALISFSLGDPETLVQHPATMTHSSIPTDQLHEFGLSEGLIRLSVGLEDTEDIINDLKQALEAASKMEEPLQA